MDHTTQALTDVPLPTRLGKSTTLARIARNVITQVDPVSVVRADHSNLDTVVSAGPRDGLVVASIFVVRVVAAPPEAYIIPH